MEEARSHSGTNPSTSRSEVCFTGSTSNVHQVVQRHIAQEAVVPLMFQRGHPFRHRTSYAAGGLSKTTN